MDRYLTYAEYQAYGGAMAESDFNTAEFIAQSHIDYLTDCRVQNMAEIPEAVKLCIMAIMKVDAKYGVDAQADGSIVTSFSTDGYSESYGSGIEQAATAKKALTDTINQMLYGVKDDEGVPLLYRGL